MDGPSPTSTGTDVTAPATQEEGTSVGSVLDSGSATGGTSPTGAASAGCVGPLEGPDTRRYLDVDVDEPGLVSLDVYRRPAATGCPVLVWVHGGGWNAGDKAGKAIDSKVAFAGDLGAVLVSVNYRLVTPDGDVLWPVMGEDVAAAVGWLIDHQTELGIDPARMALMGHSAGAHLSSIVVTNPALLDAVGLARGQVRCVVALDSAAFEITPLDVRRSALIAAAFGDDPKVLEDASPTLQAAEHPAGLPDLLVVTRGSAARVAEATEFAAAVAAAGSSANVVEVDYTHEQVNTQLGAVGDDQVTPPTRQFLQACFE